MKELYQQIPVEKRDKILDAAIQEFAAKGYEQASTNKIIQEANISKGLLFHYFQNKKNLFLATLDTCVERILAFMLPQLEELSSDLFERLLEIGKVKLRMFLEHPLEYRFLMTAFADVPADIAQEIQKWRDVQTEQIGYPVLLKGLDFSKFRKGIHPKKATQVVVMSLEAFGNQWMHKYQLAPDKGISLFDETLKEMEEVIEILKHGVYDSK